MANFLFKLLPPRPDFPFTMDEKERSLMQDHLAYTSALFQQGKVLAFGPVMDPEGPYGFGILDVADQVEAEHIAQNDPTVLAGMNRYTLSPMQIGAIQAAKPAQPA